MKAYLVLPLVAVAIAVVSPGARAESGIDLATNGYVVIQRTAVDGPFQGCEKKLPIPLANGTVFDCSERNHHFAYRPTAVLYKNVRLATYALLIDGRAYQGNISTSEGKPLQKPLQIRLPQGLAPVPGPAEGVIPGVQLPKFAKSLDSAKGEPKYPGYPAGQAILPPGQ
ncbi:MAG TPA: hypothetical protein VN821_02800 [Candidatus Udaeobacter sp.]|nr:hypothetical protein [Candidatus Udaeobacter sp.]